MEQEKKPLVNEKVALNEKALSWVTERDVAVEAAVTAHDESALIHLSTLSGGLGSREARRRAWLELLHVDQLSTPTPEASRYATPDTDETVLDTPHPDENQVLLDTRRSFVTYPRNLSSDAKAEMQDDLQVLICTVLQRHPRLSYFQGFHDIMTVLYLTLLSRVPRPRDGGTATDREEWEELVRAAEVVALCRTRDAMGKGLGPMMGMLKLLRRVLAVADPQLYRISSSISPVPTLPFFALSWILTLFSHDVDTLEPVQRIFDYLIARNPISAVYLAVAILMSKKKQMLKLVANLGAEARLDPSLLHPLFQRLPPLYADTPDAREPPPDFKQEVGPHDEPNPYTPIPLSGIFQLADRLQAKHPWDGPKIRGHEVMGPGSVVQTFSRERRQEAGANSDALHEKDEKAAFKEWTLAEAEGAIDNDVVLPGGDELDEEPDLAPERFSLSRLNASNQHLLTALAVGVVLLGVGAAVFGWHGRRARWTGWWVSVAGQWAAKRDLVGTIGRSQMPWIKAYLPGLPGRLPIPLGQGGAAGPGPA